MKKYQVTDIAGKLAKGFLYNPLTAVLGVFLLIMGFMALNSMPREEDPQISISGGAIIIAMPGASPKEIENIILKPLERKLREVRGIEHVYGTAMDNMGIVNVMYYIGENREDSNLKLYDKVMQNMDSMPKGVMQPLVKTFDIDIDIPIVTIAFYPTTGKEVSDIALFQAVSKIQQKLNSIEYVAKTTLKGAHKEQYNIQIDIGKLSAYHLSLEQVMQAVQSVAADVPDSKGRTKNDQLIIFGVKNAIENVNDVENVIVAEYMGSSVYLKDVAMVTAGIDIQNFQEAKIYTKDNNNSMLESERKQITVTVAKLAGTNAVFVSDNIVKILKEHEEMFAKEGISFLVTRNYGERANEAVNELMHHLIITIAIIAIMLVFALGWRESIIVTFSVPAILSITLFTAWMSGQTMNRITLFALLLSLGLLVDAAIIVIENIHRHLHAHGAADKEMSEILIEATDEIGAPTNVATLAIILTMVPMAFVGGMMGSFMKPIPYNVPVALIASLFVAYIFTPYLSLKLLKKPEHDDKDDSDTGAKKHSEKEA